MTKNTMTKNNAVDITSKLAQFDELVGWFQSEEFTIEQAVEKLRAADALASEIEQHLSDVKNDITVLKQKFDQA